MDGSDDLKVLLSNIDRDICAVTDPEEQEILQAWLKKLKEPIQCAELAKRKDYARFLWHMLTTKTIHFPFIEIPPFGSLHPLENIMKKNDSPDAAGSCWSESLDLSSMPAPWDTSPWNSPSSTPSFTLNTQSRSSSPDSRYRNMSPPSRQVEVPPPQPRYSIAQKPSPCRSAESLLPQVEQPSPCALSRNTATPCTQTAKRSPCTHSTRAYENQNTKPSLRMSAGSSLPQVEQPSPCASSRNKAAPCMQIAKYSPCSHSTRVSPCSQGTKPSPCSQGLKPSPCSLGSKPSPCSQGSRPSPYSLSSKPSPCSQDSRPSPCSLGSNRSPCVKGISSLGPSPFAHSTIPFPCQQKGSRTPTYLLTGSPSLCPQIRRESPPCPHVSPLPSQDQSPKGRSQNAFGDTLKIQRDPASFQVRPPCSKDEIFSAMTEICPTQVWPSLNILNLPSLDISSTVSPDCSKNPGRISMPAHRQSPCDQRNVSPYRQRSQSPYTRICQSPCRKGRSKSLVREKESSCRYLPSPMEEIAKHTLDWRSGMQFTPPASPTCEQKLDLESNKSTDDSWDSESYAVPPDAICPTGISDSSDIVASMLGPEEFDLSASSLNEWKSPCPVTASRCPKDGNEDLNMIMQLISSVVNSTTLSEFLTAISPYTSDKGRVMKEVISYEVVMFRDFVYSVFETRNQDIGDVLAKEQASLKDRYALWEQRMLSRARIALSFLKTLVPSFNFDQYKKDPDYLRKLFYNREEATEDTFETWKKEAWHKIHYYMAETKRIEAYNKERLDKFEELRSQRTAIADDCKSQIAEMECLAMQQERELAALRPLYEQNAARLEQLTVQLNDRKPVSI